MVQLLHKITGYLLYIVTKVEVVNGWWVYKKERVVVMGVMGVWCTVLFLGYAGLEKVYRAGKMRGVLGWFGVNNGGSQGTGG